MLHSTQNAEEKTALSLVNSKLADLQPGLIHKIFSFKLPKNTSSPEKKLYFGKFYPKYEYLKTLQRLTTKVRIAIMLLNAIVSENNPKATLKKTQAMAFPPCVSM